MTDSKISNAEVQKKILNVLKSTENVTMDDLKVKLEINMEILVQNMDTLIKNDRAKEEKFGNILVFQYCDPQDERKLRGLKIQLNNEQEYQIIEQIYKSKNRGVTKKQIEDNPNVHVKKQKLTEFLNKLEKKSHIKKVKDRKINLFLYREFEYNIHDSLGSYFYSGNNVINEQLIETKMKEIEAILEKKPNQNDEQIKDILRNSDDQIEQRHVTKLLDVMVYDDKIDFIKQLDKQQKPNYKLSNWDQNNESIHEKPPLSRVPCGTCPLVLECKPGGRISPENCIYFEDW